MTLRVIFYAKKFLLSRGTDIYRLGLGPLLKPVYNINTAIHERIIMSGIIYVGFDKTLTIPKKYNIQFCGEEEPTPLCYKISVGMKNIRLTPSIDYPYNELCDDDKGDNKPTYLTFWVNWQIVIPAYYMELIEGKESDAYEVQIRPEEGPVEGYKNIRLIKQN